MYVHIVAAHLHKLSVDAITSVSAQNVQIEQFQACKKREIGFRRFSRRIKLLQCLKTLPFTNVCSSYLLLNDGGIFENDSKIIILLHHVC